MRIAISGCQNSGKTTLLTNILQVWSQYVTPEKTYRDLIKDKQLPHSSLASKDTQLDILSFMIEQMGDYKKGSKVVYDRCPIDNLVYTLWCHDKGIDGFDKTFVDQTISLVKESMRSLDIIFLLRYDGSIKIVDDGLRDTNLDYIKEIDNIFDVLYQQYYHNLEADIFFPKDDSPCVIPLPASGQQRIDIISEYLTPTGELYGDEESIFNPNKLTELEALVQQQKRALEMEQKERAMYEKFKI
jgi:predicted ATPase